MARKWIAAAMATAGFVLQHTGALPAQDVSAGDDLTVQRVWVGTEPDFWAGRPSPDGRRVTDIHWDSGDLALIDLVTGELQRMGVKSGGWETVDWAESSAFSPDGSRIAFVWWEARPEDHEFNDNGYSIRTIPVDGGPSSVLVPPGEAEYFWIDDWSSDGRVLLAKAWFDPEQGENGLVLIDTSDGTIGRVPGVSAEQVDQIDGRAVFSPDGSNVAFGAKVGAGDHDVYVAGVDSGEAHPVLEGRADDRLLGWYPGGLLFYSDRGATSGIWLLPLDADLKPGNVRLLQPDVWALEPLGLSEGALYYGVIVQSPQVYIGAIDVSNGGFLVPMSPVQETSHASSGGGEFSPDGRYLAYVTRMAESSERTTVVVRAVGGDDIRTFDTDYRRNLLGWTGDGHALLLGADYPEGDNRVRLERLNLATGEVSVLERRERPRRTIVSPDGRTLYVVRAGAGTDTPEIYAIDVDSLAAGSERSIVPTRRILDWSVSPDGRSLAVMDASRDDNRDARIFTVPVEGGPPHVIFEADGRDLGLMGRSGLPWTPDGEQILFVSDGGIVSIPSEGGPLKKLVDIPIGGTHRHFRLSPDGSRFIMNAGESKGEIWMVKNLP